MKKAGTGVPQVFVSYARADKRRVVKIVAMLRKIGFEPWWDDDIPPGASWEQTIERALAESQAMIVCWSPVAIASENVRSEARFARSRGRLVQIFLEPCEPPLFFGERQGIDLSGWMGSARDPVLSRVKQALDAAIVLQPHHQPALTDTTRARRRLRYRPLIIASILAALAITAVAGWWRVHSTSTEAPSRVAVQPIKALGTDNMLADSLTDQIVTSLNDGRIPTVSKTDSQALTGGDLDRRLKSLGVAYTLDGTIERSGKTLHARVHLHDRAHHASLWSYEAAGSTDAPTTLNSAIAQSITGVISCAHRAMRPGGLTDTELLSRYLRVCDLFVNHDDATGLKSTFELLDDLRLIMAKAPDFAPAQSDFAKFAAYLAPILPPQQASAVRVESARAARRALELDPHAADAYVAQEMLLRPTDWAQREALLRTAVSVDPRWPHGNGFLAMLLTETGRMREAAIYGQRAAAADLQIDWKPFGAKMACDAGQTDSAISDLREHLSSSPGDSASKWALRWCLLDAGRAREVEADDPASNDHEFQLFREAAVRALASDAPGDREKARQLGSKLPTDASSARVVIVWSAAIGDVDTAFRFADTVSPGYPLTGITDFLFVPQTESMRRDPRFFTLAKRFGLAQFWVASGRWPDFCDGPRLSACQSLSTATSVSAQR